MFDSRCRVAGNKASRRYRCRQIVIVPILMQVGCAQFPLLWFRKNDPNLVDRVRQEMNVAETVAEMGDLATAEVHLMRACEMNPRMAESHIRLGRIRNQRQSWATAKETWLKVTSLDADEPTGWIGLAEAETALGEFDAATNHFQIAIDLAPQRAEPHLRLAELYEAQGLPQEALQSYMNCLNIDNDHAHALLRIASLQRDRGQLTQAIVRLDRVLELTPDDPTAFLERALAHRDNGQHKLAMADFRKALELQPDRHDIKLELALLMEATQQNDEARRLVDEVLASSPELIGAKELGERLKR
jgi:tetratricopeptide (TPR) repeat protein